MRACRHCSHQNADHLGYCSQCGRRLASITGAEAAAQPPAARTPSGQVDALSATAVLSRTLAASPAARAVQAQAQAQAARANGSGARHSGLRWAGDSIGYIYVYMRGKLDAGERRRRLTEERDGSQTMLAAAVRDLGSAVLRDGLQHHELTGLLEAIGRADARRETALADLAAAEKQKEAEDGRFTSQEAAREAEWKTCDRVAHEADDVLRAVRDEHDSAAARLGRIRDDRTRVAREAESAAAAGLDGKPRAAELRHRSQSLATEQRTLEEQVGRLERQLRDLREKSVALRAAAGAARSKLDQVIAARRQAASAMAATVAGHARDRGDAEREVAELTEQLGRVTAQVRPPASSLLSSYQRIDRLEETIADRNTQIAALDRSAAHYDQRKLLTGVGLVTSMLLATAAALWAVLK